MKNFLVCIRIFLLAFVFLTQAGHSQTRHELGKPVLRTWLPKEYGAQAQNWAIVQDQRGVMYFGNNDGVLEYDGVAWRLIRLSNLSACRSLALDQSGRIYVGGMGDLGYLAPDSIGQMRFISLLPQVPDSVRDFVEVWNTYVAQGSAYFNTNDYVFRWTPSRSASGETAVNGVLKLWHSPGNFRRSFVVDDVFYIRENDQGLLRMVNDSLQLVPGAAQLRNERIQVMLPFPEEAATAFAPANAQAEHRRNLLVGSNKRGLFRYDGENFHPFKTEAEAFLRENDLFFPGAALPGGRTLLNTWNGGLVLLDGSGNVLQFLNRDHGLPENTVSYVYADPMKPEAQWLALGASLARVETTGPFTFFDAERGLTSYVVKIQRHRGVLYAATGVGVFYLDAASATFKRVNMPVEQSWDLLVINEQLLAASAYGVFALNGSQATVVRGTVDSDYGAFLFHRSRQDSQRVFVGLSHAKGGLATLRWENGHWRDEGRIAGIEGPVLSLVESPAGTLWAGTSANGVLRLTIPANTNLQNVRIERLEQAHGLPQKQVEVYQLGGAPYFKTSVGGYRFDSAQQRFVSDSTMGTITPLADDGVHAWLLRPQLALGTRQANGDYLWWEMPFRRFTNEEFYTVYAEADGVAWLGGANGIIRYDSKVAVNYAVDYAALVRRVLVGEDSVIFGGTATLREDGAQPLRYAYNNPRFAYAAASYEDPARLQFQTWLEGFEERWSNWNNKTEKEFTNLPEGDYRFHVRAKNVYEHVSREAVYDFVLLPPWYRTWWAYTGYTLALGALVFAIDRTQRRRVLKKERRQAEFREAKLRAEAAELQAQILAAENARKTQELEAARQLQLSMLPKNIPQLPQLDIAVYMQTASEVGGDYYDFKVHEDGTLTAAIGDATGHGLRAGTMVAATKSLFNALADEAEPANILKKATKALKGMGIREMYMALTIAKLQGRRLQIAAAGMPFTLVYRAVMKQVEEIVLKGMPLGSFADFAYQQNNLTLQPGDTLLFMSDGFLEMFNPQGEMLGEEATKKLFAETARLAPEQIIARLLDQGKAWANGSQQRDDVTFMVMKVK